MMSLFLKKMTPNKTCHICEKVIRNTAELKVHLRIHSGIQEYKCKICYMKFSQSGTLKTHVQMVHEGIKNHQCKICDMKFGILGNLNKKFLKYL